jgi:hypothetical protein
MKNWNALRSRSWASRVMVVVVVLMAVVAVLAGVVPVSARIMIDDGGGGGGGGDGGGDDGGGAGCPGNTTVDFSVSPTYINMGESVTLYWHVYPAPGCAGMTYSISSIPVPSSVGSKVVQGVMSSRSWTLQAQIGPQVHDLATASVVVQLPPTVTITSDTQVGLFLQAIATPGQRIEIQNHVNLDLSYRDYLYIAPSVHIIGGRSATEPGPRLFTTTFPQRLFSIGSDYQDNEADNVRISGIRLEGAEMGSADSDTDPSIGIRVVSSVNVEIDNNELFGWRGSAVDVRDPFNRINLDNYNTVWVHDNFIHHNQHYGREGYGVSVGESGYALIEKNVFDYNRHAIATHNGGNPNGYYALRNLVLWNGGMNNGWLNLNTHMFDVHGSESCWGAELYCGDAGEKFEFRDNTILYDAGTAIKVRGEPSIDAWADHNVFRHPDEWGGYVDDAALVQNDPGHNFYSTNNTFGAHYNNMLALFVCDFNSDGALDSFLATGVTWWYASGTSNSHWVYLNTSTKGLGQLIFGDVNGDGICDVRDNNGVVYPGGLPPPPPPPSPLPVVPDVRGDTLTEASSGLAAAGFTRGTVSYVVDPTCNDIGVVKSQSPAAGTHAETGTPVNLSIGDEPSTPCF